MTKTSTQPPVIADASSSAGWLGRMLPAGLMPYAQLMRLDRPIGWWLLLLPCWWGLALGQIAAGGGVPNLWHGVLFLGGAVVMRGAGCALNDIADRNFDAHVDRTRLRPIASGRISVTNAFIFLALLLAIGLAIVLQFNWQTVATACLSLVIVAIYPFMKRITHWPQAVLGLAFNWGALVGWSATHGTVTIPAILLYAGGFFWTLAYDTIYAHQDKDDDIMIGVKSTALLFGANTRPWLIAFFTLATACIAAAIRLAGGSTMSYLGLALASLHAGWQVHSFNHNDSASCLKIFRSNRTYGLILLSGLLLDSLIP